MARLLTIASAVLALGCAALAQVCPDSMSDITTTYFYEYYNGDQIDTGYYDISLATPVSQGDSDGDTSLGCSAQDTYVTRYVQYYAENGCTFWSATKVSQTPTPTGCMYHFTTNDGNDLYFNMSCYDYSLDFDTPMYITDVNGKNRSDFTGYSSSVCTPTSGTTETDGPTQTWTDGPTQTWTDGPTQTWTDGPTQTYTDGPTQSSTVAPVYNYSYVAVLSGTSYESNVVIYIRDFLNISRYDDRFGTIDGNCNSWTENNNYTCIMAFSNDTQANQTIYGANNGYITYVYGASWYTPIAYNYTNATFYCGTSYPSNLVSYIRTFLNISNDDRYGTLTAWCNSTYVNGNYTCIATFRNFTQAVLSVEGANRHYIYYVNGASMIGYNPTSAPYNNNGNGGDDSPSKAPVVIGVIIGIVVVVALVGVAVVVFRRRARTTEEDGTQLNNVLN